LNQQNETKQGLLFFVTAFLMALPNGFFIWFSIMYFVWGVTGELMHPFLHSVTGITGVIIIFTWSIYDAKKTAEVIYRTCRLGAILSLLLPATTGFILFSWQIELFRQVHSDFFGISVNIMPVHAISLSFILIVLFLTGSYLAARKLDRIEF
jgi:hypothetical protein